MKYILFFFACLCSCFISANAQFAQQWQSMSSMYSVNAIAGINSTVYAATKGGMFSYDITNGAMHYWRVSDTTLLTSTITAIEQDSTGLLWIGAENGGIMNYDPKTDIWTSITSILSSQLQGIASKRITTFAFHNNIMYCAGDFGIATFTGVMPQDWIKSIGTIPVGTSITSLVIMQDTLWVGTEKGLAKASVNATLQDISSWISVSTQPIKSMLAKKDTLYIAEQDTVKTLHRGLITKQDIAGRIGLNDVSIHNDQLYYGNAEGIYAFPSNAIVSLAPNSGHQRMQDGTVILKLPSGGIAQVKSDGGINAIMPNTPAGSKYNTLAVDNASTLWVNMDEGFVGVYETDTWRNYNRSDVFGAKALGNSRFNALQSMSNGTMWIGSFGNGFAIGNKEADSISFTIMDDEARRNLAINAGDYTVSGKVAEERDGSVWIPRLTTGRDGALIIKKKTDGTYMPYQGTVSDKKFTIAEIDNAKTIWLGAPKSNTGDGNVYYFNEKNTSGNESDDIRGSLAIDDIRVIKKDASGFMWFGTGTGLNVIYSPSGILSGRQPNLISIASLRNQIVNDIAIDAINNKWIATDNGLYVLSEDGSEILATYTRQNTIFQSSVVKAIAIDNKQGIIYVATDEGLYRSYTSIVNPSPDYSCTKCYPQPFLPGIHSGVTIDCLAQESGISIVTPSGMPVKTLKTQSGRAIWDGKNEQGEFVPTGVYLIVMQSGNQDQSGIIKCAVIRK